MPTALNALVMSVIEAEIGHIFLRQVFRSSDISNIPSNFFQKTIVSRINAHPQYDQRDEFFITRCI